MVGVVNVGFDSPLRSDERVVTVIRSLLRKG
jgi:hypothetical protein